MLWKRCHVSLIAIPDAVISTLGGIYDVLGSVASLSGIDDAVPTEPPFSVEILGEAGTAVELASGLPVPIHRRIEDVASTDIIIVPSVLVQGDGWQPGRYPRLVEWLQAMHAQGASLCSACSGIFLLAETGLFDDVEATVHWGYARQFRKAFPDVPISPERPLIVSGGHQELITSGASTSWHDLVLYLVSEEAGAAVAQAVARFYALQWHQEGLAPFMVFIPPMEHGDPVVLEAQEWAATHSAVASPVEEMVARSGLAERTFKRRFSRATGHSPISYVQRLRIEDAKRRLERTHDPIDEISWQVGYEDPAFFRRLFKRTTGMTAGAYRRKFRIAGWP